MSSLARALSLACLAVGCTMGGDVFPPRDSAPSDMDAGHDAGNDAGNDAGPFDAGRPVVCIAGLAEDELSLPLSAMPITVDGMFTGSEWAEVEPLEGLYADVYIDVRNGALVLLNDWRANSEGIDPDCFNRFELTIGETAVTVRVFGDGRVSVDGTTRAITGASGFGPSPRSAFDHSIFELRIASFGTRVDVCLFDPLSLASCEALAAEPMVFSVMPGLDDTIVARRSTRSTELTRLAEGEVCATGDGVCRFGLRCSPSGPDRRCRAD